MAAACRGSGRGFWGQRFDWVHFFLALEVLGVLLFAGLMWGYCGG